MWIGFFGDSLASGMPGSSYVALLRRRLSGYTLLHYGKGNDTVISLHRRVKAVRLDRPLDLAFLWIGVNDVPRVDRWWYRVFYTLLGQQGARSPQPSTSESLVPGVGGEDFSTEVGGRSGSESSGPGSGDGDSSTCPG